MRRGIIGLVVFFVLAFPAGAAAFGPLSSFGSFGSGVGQLDRPGGVAIGPDGSAYVADSENNRIAVFSAEGAFLRAFGEGVVDGGETPQVCTTATLCLAGKAGGGAGAMDHPGDVTYGPDGNLYVADTGNNRIDVYTPEGSFLHASGKEVELSGTGRLCTPFSGCRAGVADGTAGSLSQPEGLAFTPDEYLVVADTGDERVAVLTPAGLFIRAFGKEVDVGGGNICTAECQKGTAGEGLGEIDGPNDVVAGPGDAVAVADGNNDRIDVFTSEGAFLRAFGVLDNPTALAVDAAGDLYVADTGNNRVAEFGSGGGFIRAFGEGVIDGAKAFQLCTSGSECQAGLKGTIPGSTPEPHGVAIDCRGSVYVVEENAETSFARVERFGDVAVPPPCTEGEETVRVGLRKFAPARRLKFRVKLHPKRGTATLSVSVAPLGGRLFLYGRGIRRLSLKVDRHRVCPRRAACSGFFNMPLRPTRETMNKLDATGKANVRMVLTYASPEGDPATKRKTIELRKLIGTTRG